MNKCQLLYNKSHPIKILPTLNMYFFITIQLSSSKVFFNVTLSQWSRKLRVFKMPPNYTAVGNYKNDNLNIKFFKIQYKIKLSVYNLNCLFRFLIGVVIFGLQWNLSKETKLIMHV